MFLTMKYLTLKLGALLRNSRFFSVWVLHSLGEELSTSIYWYCIGFDCVFKVHVHDFEHFT